MGLGHDINKIDRRVCDRIVMVESNSKDRKDLLVLGEQSLHALAAVEEQRLAVGDDRHSGRIGIGSPLPTMHSWVIVVVVVVVVELFCPFGFGLFFFAFFFFLPRLLISLYWCIAEAVAAAAAAKCES